MPSFSASAPIIPHGSIQLQAAARSKCPACQPLLACEKTKAAPTKRRRRQPSLRQPHLSYQTQSIGPHCPVLSFVFRQKRRIPVSINILWDPCSALNVCALLPRPASSAAALLSYFLVASSSHTASISRLNKSKILSCSVAKGSKRIGEGCKVSLFQKEEKEIKNPTNLKFP